MPAAKNLDPSSPLAVWGAELRFYRDRASLSQDQLARQIGFSLAQVSSLETARRRPTQQVATLCDSVLDTGGALLRLLDHLKRLLIRAGHPTWFGEWLEIERAAMLLRAFEPSMVPGLLQTPAYARAVLRADRPADSEEDIEALVSARTERQAVLDAEDAPRLVVMLDEMALHRPVGGPIVMAEQLDKLAEATDRRLITVQVVPLDVGAHPGLGGAFVIASLPDAPDIVYRDSIGAGEVIDSPDFVTTLTGLWESIRADALPQRTSRELVRSWAEKWKASN
ncbi:helix-turn-helix domain-containing protein [Actinomadura scrupuli]|uniref:helix-turn-helix domain-containing protein n=1 Tax=Actinomadura scrupuli TaxID=559629 RepID=UPI003D977189